MDEIPDHTQAKGEVDCSTGLTRVSSLGIAVWWAGCAGLLAFKVADFGAFETEHLILALFALIAPWVLVTIAKATLGLYLWIKAGFLGAPSVRRRVSWDFPISRRFLGVSGILAAAIVGAYLLSSQHSESVVTIEDAPILPGGDYNTTAHSRVKSIDEIWADIEKQPRIDVPNTSVFMKAPDVEVPAGLVSFDWVGPKPRLVAPFSIVTPANGRSYYIKIYRQSDGDLVATKKLAEGETLRTKMPIGEFEMRYAFGANWVNEAELFGPETQYARVNETLSFRRDVTGFLGHTIELLERPNGNLQTETIDRRSF